MKLSTAIGTFERAFGMKGAIDLLADAGFDALDFTAYYEEYSTDAYSKEYYTDIRKYAEDKGLYFNQAHGPDGSSFANPERNQKRYEEVIATMKHASYLGVKTIIIHPCQHMNYYKKGNPEKLFEYNMNFYRSLIPYCEEFGIKVALENMWQYPGMISHSTCSRPEEFIQYVDELNSEWLVACLDIGHSVVCREQPDAFIRKLGGKRLQNLHIHDVDGTNDSHTLPYFGITDWDSVMEALAEVNYTGELTYEAGGFLKEKPLELYPQYAKLMEQTGRYLIQKFENAKK